jgi:hypothetical protein
LCKVFLFFFFGFGKKQRNPHHWCFFFVVKLEDKKDFSVKGTKGIFVKEVAIL